MTGSTERGSESAEANVIVVATSEGSGRFFVAAADEPRAVLFLGHGAGGGVDAIDLGVLARRLPAESITVVRFEQPWRTAGGRIAVRAPRLDTAWNEALIAVLEGDLALPGAPAEVPAFAGGRSAGARVACRTTAAGPLAGRIAGVVACAFPLHLPGRPERSRAAELLAPSVPRLVLQGERDTFGSAAEVESVLQAQRQFGGTDVRLVPVPAADHSMRVPKAAAITAAEVRDILTQQALAFIDSTRPGRE